MTNLEKANSLREVRKRLGWGQKAMAEALGLDPTYLSQLENGKRSIDDWWITRALDIEKSIKVKVSVPGTDSAADLRASCHLYLNKVLDQAANEHEMSWVYVELQRHFPLEAQRGPAGTPVAPDETILHEKKKPSSTLTAEESTAVNAVSDYDEKRGGGEESSKPSGTGEQPSHKEKRSAPSSQETKARRPGRGAPDRT